MKLAELRVSQGELCGEPPLLLLDDVLGRTRSNHVNWLLLEAVREMTTNALISATHLDGFHGGWRQEAQILDADGLRLKEAMNVG